MRPASLPRALVAVTLAAGLAVSAGCTSAAATTPTAPRAGSSTTVYVSPSGSDGNPGTTAAPLRTPQTAVDRLPAGGGTVVLADGTYARQRIVIGTRHDIAVRAASGAHPVLDATGLTPADDLSGVVQINDSSRVSVDGLDVTGYRTTSTAKTPIGIYVTGMGSDITLTHNRVHHLGNGNTTKGSFDINAHGIAVYGTNPRTSLTGVHVDGNEVDHLTLGASEAVVVNGNVDGWSISGNRVHDDNNIGIDAIGYEETISGSARYTDANRARHGVVTGNTVSAISAQGNPSYYEDGGYCRCADGIYVDGGTSVDIGANTVTNADIGIEVAAENPKGKTNAITVHDNTVSGSAYVGLTVGGYAANRGEAYDVSITGNTLTGDNTLGNGAELLLQYKVHQTTVTGNRITSTRTTGVQLVQRVRTTGSAALNTGVTLDHNDYGAPVAATAAGFAWLGKPVTGFAAWQQTSGQDANSTFTTRTR